MQKTISRSFRLRLMALVMLGILPPLWGAIWYASHRAANIFRVEAQESMAIRADALSERVDQWHQQNLSVIDELSVELAAELTPEADFSTVARSQQLPDMLSVLQSAQTDVNAVVTVDLAGEVVADVSALPRNHANYRHQPWFQAAITGADDSQVTVSPTLSSIKSNPTIIFSKPILAQPTLSVGDHNPNVAQLQTRLQRLNYYAGPIDGIYAAATVAAVQRFQQAHHKEASSGHTVDPLTWQSIEVALEAIAAADPAPIAEREAVEGVVMMEAQLDEIEQAVDTVELGDHGYALVLDENGRILAQSEPKGIDMPALEELPQASEQAGDRSSEQTGTVRAGEAVIPSTRFPTAVRSSTALVPNLTSTLRQTLDAFPPVANLLADTPADTSGPQGFSDGQGERWMTHSRVLANGWQVVLLQPNADFSQEARLFRHLSLIAGAIALLVTAIALSICSARLTSPIQRLSSAASAISLGHLDQKIEIESNDEIGTLATAFNSVTDQLQLSFSQLAEQNEALKRLDQLKDQFLANTSHELKTPLNGMIGIAESLLAGAAGHLSEEQRQNVAMIATSSHRLTRLVNDILDFSQLQHQQLSLHRKPVGIFTSVNIVLSLSRTLVANKPLTLTNTLSADLPLVLADENRLQQILLNLVGNAIKFTEEGTVTLSAKQLETNGQTYLAVSVQDTGIGIAADRLAHIFQPFQQLENAPRSYGGTGLGLSITQHLVTLHEGKLSVASTLGEGSTFTFTLPIATVEPPLASVSVATTELSQLRSLRKRVNLKAKLTSVLQPKQAAAKLDPHKFNILVVDDEPINVQVLKNHLSLENYSVTHALNGPAALALLAESQAGDQRFDLVVLDVMMPRMSGYEVCQKLRELYPAHELPVVMLTAKNQISDLITGFHFGANDYMTKPFSKDELLTRIQSHLRLSKTSHSYGRFVPNEYLRFLEKESIVDVRLGDHVSKEMAVMFSDIRSFTTLSESMTPQENFDFVNAYLRQVSPVIRDHSGFIVKYLGDGMMAVFPTSVDDAVAAGVAKLRSVASYNRRRKEQGFAPIAVGIGIHFGHMMVGMVGESARMQGDAFSDNVNLTARLESLTKLYGVSMVISGHVLGLLTRRDRYRTRFLDRVIVKGRREPIDLYHVIDGEPPAVMAQIEQTQPVFSMGIAHYQLGDFEKARMCFEEIRQQAPEDKAAQIYCDRLQQLIQAPPEHWNSVWTLSQK